MIQELPVWINRFSARTPLIYLKSRHLINNLKFLKRKAVRRCIEGAAPPSRWQDYVPDIFYDVLDEVRSRGLEYEQELEKVKLDGNEQRKDATNHQNT